MLKPGRWQRWALEALGIVAIVVVVQVWQARGLPEGEAPALAGTTVTGDTLDLKALAAGGRPVLVAFWGTWCPVCKAEDGNLEAVARDHGFIGVAMQSGDTKAVAAHLAERRLSFPTVNDEDGAIARLWRVRGLPTHFVVDSSGQIRFRVVGYATEWGLRARLWWAENVAP